MEQKKELCCCTQHMQTAQKALKAMPQEEDIAALSSFFKVLGDPTRLRMMYIMSQGELCVQDIAASLGMTKSAISHQLSGLKENRLVKSRREGKNVFYSIDDDHVSSVLNLAMIHIQHRKEEHTPDLQP